MTRQARTTDHEQAELIGSLGRSVLVLAVALLFCLPVPIDAQSPREREAEREADRAIVRYSSAIQPTDALPVGCTGETVYDCFGGNLTCTLENVLCSAIPAGEARAVMLARLDELAEVAPRNDWLVAQRVRYAMEGRELQRAWRVAASCQGTLWRCQILRGYALHQLTPGSGEMAFDSALIGAPAGTPAWGVPSRMDPRSLLCEWTDVSRIAPGEEGFASLGDSCQHDDPRLRRFWWLVAPWWSTPNNMRRSEHFSRLVAARIHDESPDGSGGHRRSHNDRLVAEGVPNSWRGRIEYGSDGEERIAREPYTNGGYSFVPSAETLRHPENSAAEDWTLVWNDGEERMLTPYRWHPFERYQSAVLRRGGELLVAVAAYIPVLESDLADVRAVLAAGRPADLETRLMAADLEDSGLLRVAGTVDGDGWLLSLEVHAPTWNARERHGAPAPAVENGFGISAPVLVDVAALDSGAEIAEAMLPTTVIPAAPIGVYFEVYGAEPGESLEFTLSVRPVDRPLLNRIGRFFGLGSDGSYRVSWDQVLESAEGIADYDVSMDLSALAEGSYEVSVEAGRVGEDAATGSRVISLRGR